MAIKLPDFLKTIREGGAKSRVIVVLGGLAVVGSVLYLGTRFLSGPGVTGTTSSVAGAPSALQSVPGGKMSPEFYRAVSQANVQAAQQAQISGGTAVPTLLNIPGEGKEGDCTVLCSDESIDVNNDINDLVKSGKLSQEEANKLLTLTKNNATPEEFAESLNELVKQGKLTPEQARQLLERYKKQYQNKLATDAAKTMDTLAKAGKLPIEVANQLLALQKSGISPAEYAEELDRLVKEGKISPETAAQLLAQYTQQKQNELAKQASTDLKQMAKAGQLTSEVAAALEAFQRRNPSVDEYDAELKQLIAAGKVTPEIAAKLLEKYKSQRKEVSTSAALNKVVDQENAAALAEIDALEKSGKISAETAAMLRGLVKNGASLQDYHKALAGLVEQKKLSPETANILLARAQRLDAIAKQSAKLQEMQGRKASTAEYLDELRKAVKAGIITPEQASNLMQAYRSMAAAGAAVAPVAAGVPGGEDFAKLQQRLQAVEGAVPAAGPAEIEFEQPSQEAGAEAAAARQQRIDTLMAAMSGQAQQLLAAWQPPTMVHKEGAGEEKKSADCKEASAEGKAGAEGTAGSSGKLLERPLIKAGTILFAVLDTGVNSDYPDTPIMATIIQGQYKGAKLLGKLNITAPDKDRVVLNFVTMDMEDWIKGKPVNAFAIDPDTAHTVLASDVDYHYLKRYGAMFATSFMSGYASAIMSSGTSTTNPILGGSTSTLSKFSPKDKLAIGLGQVGTALTAAVQKNVDTPPTVTVNAGVGLGILFMTDVTK